MKVSYALPCTQISEGERRGGKERERKMEERKGKEKEAAGLNLCILKNKPI